MAHSWRQTFQNYVILPILNERSCYPNLYYCGKPLWFIGTLGLEFPDPGTGLCMVFHSQPRIPAYPDFPARRHHSGTNAIDSLFCDTAVWNTEASKTIPYHIILSASSFVDWSIGQKQWPYRAKRNRYIY